MTEWKKVSVRDESGEGFDTAVCGDLVMPAQFLDMQPENRLEQIRDFKYMDGDVLVCCYPKTGSHWIFNLVHFLVNPGPVEEMLTIAPRLLDLSPLENVGQQTPPRLIMSHLQPARLPREHVARGGKIVLLARNPRDTLISHLYHTHRHDLFKFSNMSWEAFFEAWVAGKVPVGSYFDYYGAWKKEVESGNPNILVVHYENLIQNGVMELRRLQTFLKVDNSNERLKQIMDRCSLNRLKVDVDKTGSSPTVSRDRAATQQLQRKGIVGDWKNHLTVAQSERFDSLEQQYKDCIFS